MKELRSIGIQPDILLCRADRPIPRDERRKIALFCNVRARGRDPGARRRRASTTCRSPITQRASTARCWPPSASPMRRSRTSSAGGRSRETIANPDGEVTIAIVGKYTGLKDAYKSLNEALVHGGIANKVKVNLDWIESRDLRERGRRAPISRTCTASSCPAASASAAPRARSGPRGFARTRGVPYFGICFGMQMAVIEAARDWPASKARARPSSARPRSR